jgi:hypothetical protein
MRMIGELLSQCSVDERLLIVLQVLSALLHAVSSIVHHTAVHPTLSCFASFCQFCIFAIFSRHRSIPI